MVAMSAELFYRYILFVMFTFFLKNCEYFLDTTCTVKSLAHSNIQLHYSVLPVSKGNGNVLDYIEVITFYHDVYSLKSLIYNRKYFLAGPFF